MAGSQTTDNNTLTLNAAALIRDSFADYCNRFQSITRRAQSCFEQCDWHATRQNQRDRLSIYNNVVGPCVVTINELLGSLVDDKMVWASMKAAYAPLIAQRFDSELAETFFNSVTRRVFATVGVDANIEFIDYTAILPDVAWEGSPIYRSYRSNDDIGATILQILQDCDFDAPFAHAALDAAMIATEIQHLTPHAGQIEIIRSVFYRGKSAYLIGRIQDNANPSRQTPIVLALQNGTNGIYVDAVLLTENETSILFSFTRSYFQVNAERPAAVIAFLKSIMPLKPVSELYIALGYNKHGKTVLYRELMRHMAQSDDKFEIARGERGMVMIVFTLPSLQVVFKVIKDKFDPPKTSTRADVMACYKLVFHHDRAGRLIDAQEFEHLAFPRDRFQPELLAELLNGAGDTITLNDDMVSIAHLYTERQITPLNLYLAEHDGKQALAAALDYGQAIKDLAATNIFPGDLFLKNFGVTRHGRVIFYDYDELALITDCRFRRIPPPRNWEDEISAQPWFTIRPNDVFPEQFINFIGLPPHLKRAFSQQHGELFDVRFWRDLKAQHEAGIVPDVFPYKHERRFYYFAE